MEPYSLAHKLFFFRCLGCTMYGESYCQSRALGRQRIVILSRRGMHMHEAKKRKSVCTSHARQDATSSCI